MLAALLKAFAQLSDPALRRVVRLGVLGAVGCYLALVAVVWLGLPHVTLFDVGWADTGAGIALGLAALVLPILFFPALVTTVMGTMLEGVADAVEARHYPQLNWPRPQKWAEIIGGTLRFLLLTVAINLLALPLYLALLVTGLTVLLAVVVNGYLLGREYFEPGGGPPARSRPDAAGVPPPSRPAVAGGRGDRRTVLAAPGESGGAGGGHRLHGSPVPIVAQANRPAIV
ncbi:MAG: EI24 domain-containing protein [Magnetospirillum sp.]|nr:EI24 domain-containing protein [Magnetospirillum sp.]